MPGQLLLLLGDGIFGYNDIYYPASRFKQQLCFLVRSTTTGLNSTRTAATTTHKKAHCFRQKVFSWF